MRKTTRRALELLLAAALPCTSMTVAHATSSPAAHAPGTFFEPNVGQTAPEVKFLARGAHQALYLTGRELVLTVDDARAQPRQARGRSPVGRSVVRMGLVGGRAPTAIDGLDAQPGVSNYLVGSDRSRWRSNIPHFGRVKLAGVYAGVDLVAYGTSGGFEYDFVVAPGAAPEGIRLRFTGGEDVRLDANGDLVIATAAGTVRQAKPVAYQTIDGARRPVAASMRRLPDGSFGFALGAYDRGHALVIDPVVSFSKRLGGSSDNDDVRDIAVDAAGNTYVTGYTESTDFPTTSSAYAPFLPGSDTFNIYVVKLNASGGVVYSTYYGGNGWEEPTAIGLDSGGQAYVVGRTMSADLATVNSFQTAPRGEGDSFILVLNASGSAVSYSSYFGARRLLGHEGTELAIWDVVVTSGSEVWLTGSVWEGDDYDPNVRLNGWQKVPAGGWDAWVMKLNPTLAPSSQVQFFTLYGGSSDDVGVRMARRASDGSILVAGNSASADLKPLPGRNHGPVSRPNGVADVFLLLVGRSGGYNGAVTIGGSGDENVRDVGFDGANNQYIVGNTDSRDYPTTPGVSEPVTDAPWATIFVTKLNGSATSLLYSTYLGGTSADHAAHGLAITSSGIAYITGEADEFFPVTLGALQTTYGGDERFADIFLTRLNVLGKRTYSTYLGGDTWQAGQAVAFANGSVYLGANVWAQAFTGTPAGTSADGLVMRLKLNALFVVNSTTLPSGDSAIKTRLQNLGFNVTVKTAAAAVTGDALGKDLVLVSSTVASAAVGANFKNVEVPVIVCEQAIQDDMSMTAATSGNFGVAASQTKLAMLTAGDVLSAGLSGTQTVTSASKTYNFGKPSSGAVKVASLTSDATKIAIYRYEAGAVMASGFVAPERRVGFFVGDDAAASLTSNGGKLFDAAIKWAAGF